MSQQRQIKDILTQREVVQLDGEDWLIGQDPDGGDGSTFRARHRDIAAAGFINNPLPSLSPTDRLAVITEAGAAGVIPAPQVRNDYLTPEMFGASSSASASANRTALQSMINAAVNQRRQIRGFGTYSINGNLVVPDGAEWFEWVANDLLLICEFRGSLLRFENSTYIGLHGLQVEFPEGPEQAALIRSAAGENGIITGCRVSRGGVGRIGEADSGVKVSRNWVIDRCYANNAGSGGDVIAFRSTENISVSNSEFVIGLNDIISLKGGESSNVYISQNDFSGDGGDDGIDMFGSGKWTHISRNYFHDMQSAGTGLPVVVKNTGTDGSTDVRFSWVERNRFERCNGVIQADTAQDSLIEANQIHDCGRENEARHLIFLAELTGGGTFGNVRIRKNVCTDADTTGVGNSFILVNNRRGRVYIHENECYGAPAGFAPVRAGAVTGEGVYVEAIGNKFIGNGAAEAFDISNAGTATWLIERNVTDKVIRFRSDGASTCNAIVRNNIDAGSGLIGGRQIQKTSGSNWSLEIDGNSWQRPNAGATSQRPAMNVAASALYPSYAGTQYFDTTLGAMIVWNGTAWVNVDGSAL